MATEMMMMNKLLSGGVRQKPLCPKDWSGGAVAHEARFKEERTLPVSWIVSMETSLFQEDQRKP